MSSKRIIAATIEGVRVVCAYVPNGQAVDSDKYHYKLRWLDALHDWLAEECKAHPQLALLGDYNIAPEDRDVHDPVAWQGQVLVSEPERAAFRRLRRSGTDRMHSACSSSRKNYSAGGITGSWRSAATWACASTISCCRRRWRRAAALA